METGIGGYVYCFVLYWQAGGNLCLVVESWSGRCCCGRRDGYDVRTSVRLSDALWSHVSLAAGIPNDRLPDFYYEPLLKRISSIGLGWLFLSGLLMACFPIGKGRGVLDRTALVVDHSPAVALVAFFGDEKKENCIWLKNMELYYYVRGRTMGMEVVAGYKAAVSDMRTLSLLNLALACQGELGDKLFHYPQQGKRQIIARMEQYGSGGNRVVGYLLPNGDYSAQKFAFEI